MSLMERRLIVPSVPLSELLAGKATISGSSALTLRDYAEEITASGFPGIRALPARGREVQLHSYLENVIHREFAELGVIVRAPETLRRWLNAYAAAGGTLASYAKILDAATPGESDKPAKATTIRYRDTLESLWLLDSVPAWSAQGELLNRLAQTPKHFLADPALAVTLLGLDTGDLLSGVAEKDRVVQRVAGGSGTVLGRLFEHLVGLSLKCYAQVNSAKLFHLRTRNGDREVDFIVEGKRGVVACEVKLSAHVGDEDVRHLKWLREQLGDRLSDAIVVTTGTEAYRRRDGIGVVPAALLGA